MNGIWKITYNHDKYGECLEQLVYGTKERAEEIAKQFSAKNNREYFVKDGKTTAEAFKG